MRVVFNRKKKLIATLLLLLTLGGIYAFNENDKYFQIAKNLDIFASFYKELNTYYVDDLPPEKLMRKGIDAMLEETDPFTDFVAEENLDDLKFMATGKYGGVGASIYTNGEWTSITDVYEGSPMDRAGVKPGDIIVSMDGKSCKNVAQEDISRQLKGAAGTPLDMVLRNPVTGQETNKKIIREEINVKAVSYSGIVKEDIGYIKMTQFTENSGIMVREAVAKLKQANPNLKGMILDLRGNPGGLLDEAVVVANVFIDKNKLIVSTKGKVKNWDRGYETTEQPVDTKIPLAVLTNHSSASASEIVAGSVQDLDRGVIIGQRSYGKGLVQTTRPLPYNAKLKVTTAKYYTPSGRCIQAIDYSHRSDDGSVEYVPDSMRKSFTTLNGRPVKDGGGIEPDTKVEPTYISQVALTLLRKQFIFDWATEYYYKHPGIAPAAKFALTDKDFEDFEKYLENKDYSYKTKSEEALEAFRNTAKKEKYYDGIQKELAELEEKMKHDKKQDLEKNKTEIKRLLEEEIVNRYYLQKGRIIKSLDWDNEVIMAANTLHNPALYKQLLTKK
ncbi:C-terminal processing peptidase-3. Serine peptidase. MEROPS family S41A [Chitinophaga terrae (ex Kim and Jung 2007)]|jgi:carboxyl-terminal processing protease|uniref:C-terminal processing peptidase-3. Serine peptidase. MEROPS family S41A n=1 Tax=Chitinophaga terrae (ex Kim and Jung 2007) TaxID=408074 RepID=A0A1H3XXP3_9BACT|nr:S41 family peptidase [Chitinophaga terrae (ex Kim and Jung 2007)]MDQ0105744.1 carboxyl-terminal processing protease [Chitinophaga terrae (ex Kim and Jung 2007)]GEP89416.1 peptidase S41 [Chitinophaga terrae (ex Kim and Jung 2007)]SEA03374.1 C-terminal processing peptidase-3. Serine peptidase. MEROPS family S41A [Chitinophaga terrae (ex Kim and Jung 2007)]